MKYSVVWQMRNLYRYAYQKQNAPRNKPRGAFIIFIPDTAFQCPYVKR